MHRCMSIATATFSFSTYYFCHTIFSFVVRGSTSRNGRVHPRPRGVALVACSSTRHGLPRLHHLPGVSVSTDRFRRAVSCGSEYMTESWENLQARSRGLSARYSLNRVEPQEEPADWETDLDEEWDPRMQVRLEQQLRDNPLDYEKCAPSAQFARAAWPPPSHRPSLSPLATSADGPGPVIRAPAAC